MIKPNHIALIRTDSIGDVVLTLPMSGFLKEQFPGVKITFIGKSYTQAVVACCLSVDEFIDWNEIEKLDSKEQIAFIKQKKIDTAIHVFPVKSIQQLFKKAKVKNRIATSHRWYSWLYCNYKVNFDRKKSDLHESQLNFKLLQPLGVNLTPSLEQLHSWLNWKIKAHSSITVNPEKKNIIIHPKSKGSAREWRLDNFSKLINELQGNDFHFYITGTAEEEKLMNDFIIEHKNNKQVSNLCGQLKLDEFIHFISQCDVLVAASTGPLHLAAVSGIVAIGIYPPIRPMHPGRWRPLGENVYIKVNSKACNDCKKSSVCSCISSISPLEIKETILFSLSTKRT